MFKDNNFDRIAEETNRYAWKAMETKPDPAWRETDAEEVKAFFALNILFGIKQLPEVYSYWSKNQLLGVPEVQKIFPRNRFAKISQYLHPNDKRRELPRGHANHDKLFKARPILDSIVEAVKSEYRLSKNVSIDEAMIPFKGRLSLKQYMPLKPVKRGIKVWECADSSYGFVCDLEVYTGKQCDGNPEQGLGHSVVHNLTLPLVGKNHHVFVDNFFEFPRSGKRFASRSNLYLRNRSWKLTRHTAANCPFDSKSQVTSPRRVVVPSQKEHCRHCMEGQEASLFFELPI